MWFYDSFYDPRSGYWIERIRNAYLSTIIRRERENQRMYGGPVQWFVRYAADG